MKEYFNLHRAHVFCQEGCSSCCEKGDYPVSQIELAYLMQGYISLDNEQKTIIQRNIKNIERGGACPFLIKKRCSVYKYRPVVCRVHGLAYMCGDKVKLPYCVNEGKNYSGVYQNGEVVINPILENLDTPSVLKQLEFGDIRNLYDWIKK